MHGVISITALYIDNKGNVLTYNNPENWNFPDNDINPDRKSGC